jgi:hypothetical protein
MVVMCTETYWSLLAILYRLWQFESRVNGVGT